MFISFEGIEGSGKSLQIRRAQAYLDSRGIACVVTREPGGTEFGASIRRVLLCRGGGGREPLSELLLYLADRVQHLHEVIEPALSSGAVVLSDRYHDATRAYQGAARGIPLATIDALARILGIREPDRTILIDLDPELGLSRARQRNAECGATHEEGRFEAEELSFHRRVRNAYLELARLSPDRIAVIPGSGDPDQVSVRIAPLLDLWLTL
jgi:dTMP kinase